MAFVFAASSETLASNLPRFAWRQSGGEFESPDGVAVASPERVLLHYDEVFGRGTPEAPERNDLATSHTLRVNELKTTLGIAERDVPCLHFHFVESGVGQVVRLLDIRTSLYAYIKCLVTEWEELFAVDDERRRLHGESLAAAHVLVTKEGQARRRKREVEERVQRLAGAANDVATNVLRLIPITSHDSAARREAFKQLKALRTLDQSELMADVIAGLNELIDRARHQPVSSLAQTAVYFLDDHDLLTAFAKCSAASNSTAQTTEPIWDVFIAHAGEDSEFAVRLYELLCVKLRVFLDSRCLLPGDDWDVEIPRAQRCAAITVVLVSRMTMQAYYAREEIALAIARARRPDDHHRVIPVLLPGTPPSCLPYGLRAKHHLTISAESDLHDAALKILSLHSG